MKDISFEDASDRYGGHALTWTDALSGRITGHAQSADAAGFERPASLQAPSRTGTPAAPRRSLNVLACRALDIVGSAIGLLLLAPLLLSIAVAIRITSPGPALFRQKRYGMGGALFHVLKFRTMNVAQGDPSGRSQTRQHDPRVTRFGRFLRRTSFDELPQLINVLKGDMSLVGPRPHVPGMLADGVPYEEFDPRYMTRHAVPPGITGLAQVKGFRGETDTEYRARMRLEYDLAYISKRSFWLNVKIIVATIRVEFVGGSGY